MKKLAVLLITAIFMISIVPAYCMDGSVIWQMEFDTGSTNEAGLGITADSNKNVIIVGYDSGTIVKYDTNGNKLWDQATISDPKSVAVDSSNNILVGGSGGIAKYGQNGGAALNLVNPGSVQDIAVDSNNNVIAITGGLYLYKYDSNLNLLSGFPVDINTVIHATSVAVDSNNNIIVAGFEGSSNNPFKVVKFDSNGNQLWAKTYDVVGVNDQANGVTVDSNNNIIATGCTNDGDDMLTIKYSSNGNQLWVKTYKEGAYDTGGQAVAADTNGNIFVASYFSTPPGYDNWIIVKYDTNGNFGWKSINPGNHYGTAYDITVDTDNNILATGYGWEDSPPYIDYFYTVKYQGEPKKNKSLPIDFILKILKKNKNK